MRLLAFFHSVVCCVVMIYCIVIIYLPSMEEAETNFIVSIAFHTFYSLAEKQSFQKQIVVHQSSWSHTGAKAVYNNPDRAKHLKCVPGADHFHFGLDNEYISKADNFEWKEDISWSVSNNVSIMKINYFLGRSFWVSRELRADDFKSRLDNEKKNISRATQSAIGVLAQNGASARFCQICWQISSISPFNLHEKFYHKRFQTKCWNVFLCSNLSWPAARCTESSERSGCPSVSSRFPDQNRNVLWRH